MERTEIERDVVKKSINRKRQQEKIERGMVRKEHRWKDRSKKRIEIERDMLRREQR